MFYRCLQQKDEILCPTKKINNISSYYLNLTVRMTLWRVIHNDAKKSIFRPLID